MDLLKEEMGTTILETLVVILLLGILVTLTAGFFSTIFNKNILKGDALLLAQQEISSVLSEKSEKDTTYTNATENLKVYRIIYKEDVLNRVEVLVSKTSSDSLIIMLKASYQK